MNSASDSEMESKTDLAKPIAEEDMAGLEDFLPKMSKGRYIKVYTDFMKWRADQEDKSFTETVFMKYFTELSKKVLPATLWCVFSMLRSTVYTKHDTNIKHYKKLKEFLKKQSHDVESKINRSKVFTAEDVENFLNYAPDEIYLATKVILIFGLSGACKSAELTNILVDDVKQQGQCLAVNLRDNKANVVRTFTVRDKFARFVEKYQRLRPENMEIQRFFIKYQNGKCYKQVIGKNKILEVPKQIADYLRLPNSELYTGYCFRKSAKLLAQPEADLSLLKRRGDEIEEPVKNKNGKIDDEITEPINIRIDQPRTVTAEDLDYLQEDEKPREVTQSIKLENYPYSCPIIDERIQFHIKKETSAPALVDERILLNIKKETSTYAVVDERIHSPTLANRYMT